MPDGAAKSSSVKELLGLVEPENHKQVMETLRMLGRKIDDKELAEVKGGLGPFSLNFVELFRRLRTGEKLF